ncbi:hypothetical protein KDA_46460 [Dictyobacter alpinus]|uniref:Uncharacterized protein n=1 Tax=Dictyobacter alpinus TaxID=2014873 RepID=A0A402BD03_9CHLR|nr:DoxX family protein [Dictyobacter alpinus]GCE29162.1 hypothetical protein KDA_46460 [Dictyobacter alpinus]
MKAKIITYWVTTAIITLELLAGGISDLVHSGTMLVAGDPVVDVMTRLGYPTYMLTIMGVWKLLAVIAFLVPRFPRVKEWAYAGEIIAMTGAAVSNAVCNLGAAMVIQPAIFAILSIISWALRPQSRMLGTIFSDRSEMTHSTIKRPA